MAKIGDDSLARDKDVQQVSLHTPRKPIIALTSSFIYLFNTQLISVVHTGFIMYKRTNCMKVLVFTAADMHTP